MSCPAPGSILQSGKGKSYTGGMELNPYESPREVGHAVLKQVRWPLWFRAIAVAATGFSIFYVGWIVIAAVSVAARYLGWQFSF